MKTKILGLIAASMIITLSFSFTATSNSGKKNTPTTEKRAPSVQSDRQPIGGFSQDSKD